MGSFAVGVAGKAIAIIDDRTAYGQGLADEFEKAVKAAGGNVVKREFTNDKAVDFRAILTSIEGERRPDLLRRRRCPGRHDGCQMRELGVKAQFVGGEMLKSPKFIELAGPVGGRARSPRWPACRWKDARRPRLRDEVQGEIQRRSRDLLAVFLRRHARVMVAAMQRADSTEPAKYLPELAKTKQAGITSANIGLRREGRPQGPAASPSYQVQKGAWVVL